MHTQLIRQPAKKLNSRQSKQVIHRAGAYPWWKLLEIPHIKAAIRKQCEQMLANSAPLAILVLMELAESSSSVSVRFQAACSLLDRAGFKNPVQVEIQEHRIIADVDRELS